MGPYRGAFTAATLVLLFLGAEVRPAEARVPGLRAFGIERWSSAVKEKLAGLESSCKDPALCPEAFSIHLPTASNFPLPAGVVAATKPSASPSNDPSIDDIVR